MKRPAKSEVRRKFLQMLAASPLLAHHGLGRLMAAEGGSDNNTIRVADELEVMSGPVITSPEEAVDVFDFVPVARKNLPPAHFGFLATGVGDDSVMRANREGFKKYRIRSPRMVDTRKIDMSVKLFGTTYSNPIFMAPVGGERIYNPEGEVAAARAARAKDHLFVLATGGTTRTIEDVTAARGAPVWVHMHPTDSFDVTRGLLKRVQAAGCPVVMLLTENGGGFRETEIRLNRTDPHECTQCHGPSASRETVGDLGAFADFAKRHPMYDGLDVSKATQQGPKFWNWDLVKQIKDATTMKVLLKGIMTKEDTQMAVENGVDGVVVSNHGGRQGPSDSATIEVLPEVVEGAGGRIPVLIDSGFRRGTDVYKALALGAKAIFIGRPYAYGLAAFGQKGVEAVLAIMRREFHVAMQSGGTLSIDKITKSSLQLV